MNALLVDKRLAIRGKTVSFEPDMVGLLVFGGVDPVSKFSQVFDAYPMAFSPEKNQATWASVSAAPLIRNCLQSDKVIHKTGSQTQSMCSTRKSSVQTIMLVTY